jgi:hypothetical protein
MDQMQAVVQQQQAQLEHQAAALLQQGVQIEALNLDANQRAAADEAAAVAAAEAAAAQPANPNANAMPRGYRPEGPPRYHGKQGEDVEAWLFQLEESNRLFPIVDEQQRIRYVALSLRDTAAKWYSAMQMADPPQIGNWVDFVFKLRTQFVHMDQKWVARNAMHSIKQLTSVREYSVKFRNLQILIPDMSAADALDKFIRGLKDFAWKVWRRKFTTLEEAMVYAEELDLEVQQKSVLCGKYDRADVLRKSTRPGQSFGGNHRFIPQQSRAVPSPAPRVLAVPMDLGVIRMNDAEKSKHMQDGLCFNCHKPGHRANHCPKKSGNGERRK